MNYHWRILSTPLVAAVSVAAGFGVFTTAGIAEGENEDARLQVIGDYAAFETQFIGPKISDPKDAANYFVIKSDGTIEGTWFGKDLSGSWRWEDGFFCRSLSAPRAAPEDCQEWSFADGEARLVRNRGNGDATIYAVRD